MFLSIIYNFLWPDKGSAADKIINENVEDEPIIYPKDFDKYEWWNPFDLGGNYHTDIEDYNKVTNEELARKNEIKFAFYSILFIIGVYVIKK